MKLGGCIRLALAFVTALAVGAARLAADESGLAPDLTRLREQFRAYYLEGPAAERGVTARALVFARDLAPDGHWPDIDYSSKDLAVWSPLNHYSRILTMAVARLERATAEADRPMLLAAIHRALAFWIASDFQAANWWYNVIGAPKQFGAIGVLLGDDLLPAERAYLLEVNLPRSKLGMTGQNRIWLAGNVINLGLLREDPKLIADGANAIWDELQVQDAEGLQPDFTFHQHGPQPQMGNYGLGMVLDVARWGLALRGTRWAMPEPRLANLRRYILEGMAWTVWRGRMDLSACGRQFRPGSPKAKADSLASAARQMQLVDPAAADGYGAVLARNRPEARNDLVGCRAFWRSDYVVQRSADRLVSLRMSSRRVIGAESINGENVLGYYLGDGVTCFYRQGDEYDEIFPVWNWRRLPGVTCAQSDDDPPAFRNYRLEGDFTGGLADGGDGIAVLEYARDGVQARKAWFFAGDETVMLGAGIRSKSEQPVATTINQCRLRGEVRVKRVGQDPATLPAGSAELAAAEWIEHDGWRYTFPVATSVRIEAGMKTGNWRRALRSSAAPTGDVTLPVFTLWLDHGMDPSGAAYACVVGPAGRDPRVKILANSPAAQAVALGGGRRGWVLHQPQTADLESAPRVTVNAPTLLLHDGNRRTVAVADPTHRLTALDLTIGSQSRRVELPQGGQAGSTVIVPLAANR